MFLAHASKRIGRLSVKRELQLHATRENSKAIPISAPTRDHFWLRVPQAVWSARLGFLSYSNRFAYHSVRNCSLSDRCSASQKMYEKYHYTDHQQNVNEAGGNVKGKKSQ
jgi:hypothetical protein